MADVSAPLQASDKLPDRQVADRTAAARRPNGWTKIGAFFDRLNTVLSYAKGLPLITLIGSLLQLENIRVKYRPVGFACHIPFVTPFIDLFSNYCTPVRTAHVRKAESGGTDAQQKS